MAISPEQFNKIALREDLKKIEMEVDGLKASISSIINTLDQIVRNFQSHDVEHAANIAAHDRFEARLKLVEAIK